MRNLEVTGLRKVGPSILVESSMVYLGPFLRSPKGALELVSCVSFVCEITPFPPFFRNSCTLKADEGNTGSV